MLPYNSEAKYGYILETILSSEVVHIKFIESSFFAILKAWLVLSDFPCSGIVYVIFYLIHSCFFLLFKKVQFSTNKNLGLDSIPHLLRQSFQNYYTSKYQLPQILK